MHGILCVQEHLFEHFCDSERSVFLNDVSITVIDKTDPTSPLQRENCWKRTLKTFTLNGFHKFIAGFDLVYVNWHYLCSCSYYSLQIPKSVMHLHFNLWFFIIVTVPIISAWLWWALCLVLTSFVGCFFFFLHGFICCCWFVCV